MLSLFCVITLCLGRPVKTSIADFVDILREHAQFWDTPCSTSIRFYRYFAWERYVWGDPSKPPSQILSLFCVITLIWRISHFSSIADVVAILRDDAQLGSAGALWGLLGVTGALWGSLGLSGASWGSLGLSGALWGSLGLSGALWGSLGLPGPLWGFLGLSGPLWGSLGLPREADSVAILRDHAPFGDFRLSSGSRFCRYFA